MRSGANRCTAPRKVSIPRKDGYAAICSSFSSNTTFNNVWSVNVGTDSYVPTSISVAVPPATATDQTIVKAKVLTAASLTAAKKILFTVAYVDE